MGYPIAIFVNKKTGDPLCDSQVNDRIIEAIEQEGIEAWHKYDGSYF